MQTINEILGIKYILGELQDLMIFFPRLNNLFPYIILHGKTI